MKRIAWAIGIVASAVLVAAGCNAVLGNDAGILAVSDASTLQDVVTVTTTDAGGDAGLSCNSGEKACFGTCKGTQDTTVGCSDPSCVACPTEAHASASCIGGSGGFVCNDACRAGYDDCNSDLNTAKSDGCESDLSLSKTCGRCDNDCTNATNYPTQPEYCVTNADAGTYACNTNCPYTICGTECADLTDSTANCGSCGNDCSTQITNGVAQCVASTCTVKSCDSSYHECNNKCVSVSDVAHCGTSCSPCNTAPTNGVNTCTANAGVYSCSYTCNFVTCGSACCASGQTCTSGACTTPVVCAPPTIACPLDCVGVAGACTDGCIDPTTSPTCGGECQAANDCSSNQQVCCGGGSGSSGNAYSCQDPDEAGLCGAAATP